MEAQKAQRVGEGRRRSEKGGWRRLENVRERRLEKGRERRLEKVRKVLSTSVLVSPTSRAAVGRRTENELLSLSSQLSRPSC